MGRAELTGDVVCLIQHDLGQEHVLERSERLVVIAEAAELLECLKEIAAGGANYTFQAPDRGDFSSD